MYAYSCIMAIQQKVNNLKKIQKINTKVRVSQEASIRKRDLHMSEKLGFLAPKKNTFS